MESETKLGMNRTGAQMAPLSAPDMLAYALERGTDSPSPDAPSPTNLTDVQIRTTAALESQRVGSIPPPGTIKGLVSTTLDKVKGTRPEVLIDKLGERAAFERGGTRLYDAMLVKCSAAITPVSGMLEGLQRIRDEEAAHFLLISEAIESLGADPTAMTPCADIVGVQAMGLIQAITDPRTTVPQCLNALLTAELVDNAGWELLITLARKSGHEQLATRFETALAEEQQHMTMVKTWLQDAVLLEAT
ncbi:ferritin-like domain-containing protein [Cupriavidus plantarum]|uniref:ferritin-like domain-containing protein n=1 Tax=Cupriavidus plantarum TaxID=942865 RepID=UPI00339D5619